MKKILALIIALLIPFVCHAQVVTGSATLWEKAAYGDIPGLQYVRLSGWNAGITTTFEAVWGESAAYAPLAVALTTPYCASTSANDVLTSGSGAWTARIKGVNTSFAAFSEDINLNGQTSVTLATANILFISSIEVLTANTGGVNAGVIACGTGARQKSNSRVRVADHHAVEAAGGAGGGGDDEVLQGVVPGFGGQAGVGP